MIRRARGAGFKGIVERGGCAPQAGSCLQETPWKDPRPLRMGTLQEEANCPPPTRPTGPFVPPPVPSAQARSQSVTETVPPEAGPGPLTSVAQVSATRVPRGRFSTFLGALG